jgi:glycosyltransferase involved in cell wall biosynthesis
MRVCMLLHKSVAHDTRVRREASALSEAGHEVAVVHLPAPGEGELTDLPFALVSATLPGARRNLPRPLRLGAEAIRLALRAASTRPDVVHAHDAAMLLPGILAARRSGARLVYDSHELATEVPYRSRIWAGVVAAAERLGVPRADAVIAVSDGIAMRLNERYWPRRPVVVIRNVPDLPTRAAKSPNLRRELGIGGEPLLLHQGAVDTGRGSGTLLRALHRIPDGHLLFLGVSGSAVERLRAEANACGVLSRAHFLPPVEPESLLPLTAQADVGISLLEPSCENHRLALPNKLFEYLAAGLPVVVSDLAETGRLVREQRLGWCADPADVESVATALSAALAGARENGLKGRLRRAAAELSWARERERLLELYEEIGEASPEPAGATHIPPEAGP